MKVRFNLSMQMDYLKSVEKHSVINEMIFLKNQLQKLLKFMVILKKLKLVKFLITKTLDIQKLQLSNHF